MDRQKISIKSINATSELENNSIYNILSQDMHTAWFSSPFTSHVNETIFISFEKTLVSGVNIVWKTLPEAFIVSIYVDETK
jgi:hypothetical protein